MKFIRSRWAAFGLAVAGLLLAGQAAAQTLRIANQGDILSLDPHSLNESLQLSVMANVYEPLVGRNKDQSLAPLLATSWRQMSTTVWRSELRKGPGINGWTQEQDKRLPFDPEASRKLLAEAGYANHIEVTLHCPSDRYVNDRQICKAVAAHLGKVGVKVDLAIESKRTYFPKVLRRDTSFYLFGWTPATYGAHDALDALTGCPDTAGSGLFNLGGYCNPKLDALADLVRSESDRGRRNALIKAALALQAEDIGTLPLHQQALAWGVSKKVELTQMADDAMPFKWMSLKR